MICFNGEQGKGSCRSYGGFNLFEALSACSEHLVGFGGHALAAGLNIRRENLDAFRKALNEYYQENRPAPQPEVSCDLLITDPRLLSLENVQELDKLEPFGSGNPKPVFCLSDVELELASNVGGGRHLRLRVRLGRSHFDGIFFGHTAESQDLHEGDRVDLAFTPQINEFRGHVSVQLLVSAARKHDPAGLCSCILSGDEDACWAAVPYCPQRGDFVRLWRSLGEGFPLPRSAEALMELCPEGMPKETFVICLTALMQSGLLRSDTGDVCGADRVNLPGKADLEATRIMRSLRREGAK